MVNVSVAVLVVFVFVVLVVFVVPACIEASFVSGSVKEITTLVSGCDPSSTLKVPVPLFSRSVSPVVVILFGSMTIEAASSSLKVRIKSCVPCGRDASVMYSEAEVFVLLV